MQIHRSKNDPVNNLGMLLEGRSLTRPRVELWPEGMEELESFECSTSDSGSVHSGAPGAMHVDCVMSLALAARQLRPVIQIEQVG